MSDLDDIIVITGMINLLHMLHDVVCIIKFIFIPPVSGDEGQLFDWISLSYIFKYELSMYMLV